MQLKLKITQLIYYQIQAAIDHKNKLLNKEKSRREIDSVFLFRKAIERQWKTLQCFLKI